MIQIFHISPASAGSIVLPVQAFNCLQVILHIVQDLSGFLVFSLQFRVIAILNLILRLKPFQLLFQLVALKHIAEQKDKVAVHQDQQDQIDQQEGIGIQLPINHIHSQHGNHKHNTEHWKKKHSRRLFSFQSSLLKPSDQANRNSRDHQAQHNFQCQDQVNDQKQVSASVESKQEIHKENPYLHPEKQQYGKDHVKKQAPAPFVEQAPPKQRHRAEIKDHRNPHGPDTVHPERQGIKPYSRRGKSKGIPKSSSKDFPSVVLHKQIDTEP